MNVDSKPLALIQFATFLLRNLPEIAPNIVVLFFNNETAHQANHVSQAISGYQQRIFNYDQRYKEKETIRECALVINFINITIENYIMFGIDKREIKVIMADMVVPSHYTSANDLGVKLVQNLLLFTTWKSLYMNESLNQGIEETELMKSYPWFAFLRQVKTLPADESLLVIDNIQGDFEGVSINEISKTATGLQNSIRFVSGFRIGIYKIIAERLITKRMSYLFYPIHVHVQFTHLQPLRYRDERLSLRYVQIIQYHTLQMSFKVLNHIQSYTNVQPERYVILVPRVVVNGSSSNLVAYQILTKCLIVVGLLIIVGMFALLRYCFQSSLANSSTEINYSVYLFIDTFARSLGMSAGKYIAKTTSERQMLVVVGFFGILSGGIFSGILYEQLFDRDPVEFLYKTFDDICQAKVNLVVPFEILNSFSDVAGTLSKNCTPIMYSYKTPNKTVAVIYNEDLISDIDYMSRNYMVLEETFLSKPGIIYVSESFLERPIREVIEGCVESGIWSGLWSIAVHLQNLDRFRGQTVHYDEIGPTMGDTQYAFWILIIGLVVATIVFGGEVIAVRF